MTVLQTISNMSILDFYFFLLSVGSVPCIRAMFPRNVTKRIDRITLPIATLFFGSLSLVGITSQFMVSGLLDTTLVFISVVVLWLAFFAIYGYSKNGKTHREPPTK